MVEDRILAWWALVARWARPDFGFSRSLTRTWAMEPIAGAKKPVKDGAVLA